MHTWENDLGCNHEGSKSGLVLFAIKGKLMKNYPDTQIYLHKALFKKKDSGEIHFDMSTRATEANGGIIKPVAQAFFREDIYVVGFKVPLDSLVGNPSSSTDCGYMLAFKQETENLSFNLDNVDCNVSTSADFAKETAVQPYVCAKHVLTYL